MDLYDVLLEVVSPTNAIWIGVTAALAYPGYIAAQTLSEAVTRAVISVLEKGFQVNPESAKFSVTEGEILGAIKAGQVHAVVEKLEAETTRITRLDDQLSLYGRFFNANVVRQAIARNELLFLDRETARYALTLFEPDARNLASAAINLVTYSGRAPTAKSLLSKRYFFELAMFGKTLSDETVFFNVEATARELLKRDDRHSLASELKTARGVSGPGRRLADAMVA